MALILDIEGGSQINIWTSKQLTLGIPVDKVFLRLLASIEATAIGFLFVDNLTTIVLPDIKVLIKMVVLCFFRYRYYDVLSGYSFSINSYV
jgi:chitinase